MYLFIATICVLIAFAVHLRMKKVLRYQKLTANIPEINSFPLIGCILEIGITGTDILNKIDKLVDGFRDICKGWLGPYFMIAVTAPDIIGEILSNDKLIDKPFIYKFTFPQIEPSTIFVANGNVWRKRRKMIAPAFHFRMLDQYLSVFNLYSRIYVENLKSEIGKPSFDISHFNNLLTLGVILESFLGQEGRLSKNGISDDNKLQQIVEALHGIENAFTYRGMRIWFYPDVTFFLSPVGKKTKQHLKTMYDFIDQRLAKKLNEKPNSERNLPEKCKGEGNKCKSFLNLLLEQRDCGTLSYKEVQDELLNMIIAGSSTAASTLGFIMYCLMKNQDVQEKVVNELNTIFNGSHRDVTTKDLQKMDYLEMVIKESMRLYPSAPFIFREVNEDVHLKSGYTLPKGASVILFFYKLHRRVDYFPNPLRFDPERFNTENSSGRNFYAFTPFSGGTRICIGQKVAMMEIKVILSHALRNYKILPPSDDSPDINLAHEMVLHSTTGFHMKLDNR